MSRHADRVVALRDQGLSHAQAIYQDLLDQIGAAITQNDFVGYRSYFRLPHRMETLETRQVIETEAQLETVFNGIVDRLRGLGSNAFTRHCTVAEFSSDTQIRGCHDTHVVRQNSVIEDSYSALSTLVLEGPDWLVADSQYLEPHTSIPSGVLARSSRST